MKEMSTFRATERRGDAYNGGMTRRSDFGAWGEAKACGYLVEKRFRIIDRNVRRPWGEIDIVSKSPDGTLVFVEVKTMHGRGPNALTPEDQMGAGKVERFRRAAALYAGGHPELINESRGWRLDVVTVTVPTDREPGVPRGLVGTLSALLRGDRNIELHHYENV
jgi:putative endonuclease